MRQSLSFIRKGNRYSTKQQKVLNIATPNAYEKAEYLKYEKEIDLLEQKVQTLKLKREFQEEADREGEGGTISPIKGRQGLDRGSIWGGQTPARLF